jgi:hypothetical protein
MPDQARHDDACVIPVPTRHSGECRNLLRGWGQTPIFGTDPDFSYFEKRSD